MKKKLSKFLIISSLSLLTLTTTFFCSINAINNSLNTNSSNINLNTNQLNINQKSEQTTSKYLDLLDIYEPTTNVSYNNVEFKELSLKIPNDFSDPSLAGKTIFKLYVDSNNNLKIEFNKEASNEKVFTNSIPRDLTTMAKSWYGTNIFRIQKVTGNYNETSHKYENSKLIDLENSNSSSQNQSIGFNSDYGFYFFNGTSPTPPITLNDNEYLLVQLYAQTIDNNYNVSLTCIKNGQEVTINKNSSQSDQTYVNYSRTNSDSLSTGIEGYLGLINGKWVWTVNNTGNNEIESEYIGNVFNQNLIPSDYFNMDAVSALNSIPVNTPSEQFEYTWKNLASFRPYAMNSLMIYKSKLYMDANKSNGTINAYLSAPCWTIKNFDNKNIIYHYVNDVNKSYPFLKTTLKGFSCGSSLINNEVDASSLNNIPQKVLSDNALLNQLYSLIYQQCFGDNNLLPSFNPSTDITLNNPTFNNIDGTINAELIIKNNYIDNKGNEITNNVQKSFGNITINNFLKIQPTTIKNLNITLNQNDSIEKALSEQTATSAANSNNLSNFKQTIFNHINEILNNLPTEQYATKNFSIDNIEDLTIDNISSTINGKITLTNIKINYYYNDTNGSYTNNEPFIINNLVISGFLPLKATIINSGDYKYSDNNINISDIYPQIYIESNKTTLITNLKTFIFNNTNKGLNIIQNAPKDFTIQDINLTANNVSFDNENGNIKVTFSLNKWIDDNQNIQTGNSFPEKTIYLTGFKTAIITKINNGPFNINNMSNTLATDFINEAKANTILTNEIFNNAFQNNNIISGTKPIDTFNQTNIKIDRIYNPNNQLGQISVDIYLTSYINNQYNIELNQNQNNSLKGTIVFSGFKQITESKLMNNTFTIPNVSNSLATSYTDSQVISFIQQKQINNELLFPVSENFNVDNDLQIDQQSIIKNNKEGKITFNISFKNFYNAQYQLVTTFTNFGLITLNGFNTSPTKLLTNTFNISQDPQLGNKQAISVTNEDILTYLVNIQNQNKLLSPVPQNFNPQTDIIINSLNPDNEKGTITVNWSVKNVFGNDVNINPNPISFPTLYFNGFLPSTYYTKVDPNPIYVNNDYANKFTIEIDNNIAMKLLITYKSNIFSDLPNNFDINKNLSIKNIYNGNNQEIDNNINNYLKYNQIVCVEFTLNNFINESGEVVNGQESKPFYVQFRGFKPYLIESINNRDICIQTSSNTCQNLLLSGDSIEANKIVIKIDAYEKNKYLTAESVYDELKNLSVNEQIDKILHGDPNNERDPIISFNNNWSDAHNDNITISNINNIYALGNSSLVIECQLTNNYYFLSNNIDETLAINPSKTYKFIISNFNANSNPELGHNIVTIAVSASVGGVALAVCLIIVIIILKNKVWNRKKDIYEDDKPFKPGF